MKPRINFQALPQISLSKLYASLSSVNSDSSLCSMSTSNMALNPYLMSRQKGYGKQFDMKQTDAYTYQKQYNYQKHEDNLPSHVCKGHATKEMKIQSAFYQRIHHSKGPCQCAYHRMKRYKQRGVAVHDVPNQTAKTVIQQYKKRIAKAVKGAALIGKKTQAKIMLNRVFRQTENQTKTNFQSNTQKKLRQRQMLDNYNHLFEQILRKRMQPLKDYEKIQNLLKFLRSAATYDSKYLQNIRDYIHLHLLKVSQKIPLDQILSLALPGDQTSQSIKKIAQIMNCKQDVALEFVKGVQKCMNDMQNYLISRAQKKFNNQQMKDFMNGLNLKFNKKTVKQILSQNDANQLPFADGENTKNKNQRQDKQNQGKMSIQSIYRNLQNNSMEDSNCFENQYTNHEKRLFLQLNKKNSISSRSILNDLSSSSRKRGKRSHASNFLLQQLNGKQKDTQEKDPNQSDKTSLFKQKNPSVELAQSTLNKQNTQLKRPSLSKLQKSNGMMRKSKFNSSFKAEKQDEESKLNGSIKQKERKGQLHGKKRALSKIVEPPNPFSTIKYGTIMNKQQFERVKYLLDDNHMNISDQQRMRKLFNLIQRRISNNPQFLQQFIKMFEEVLTPQQIQELRNKFNDYQFKKMVGKLMKQVDNCLLQLKNSDQLVWKEQQQQPSVPGPRPPRNPIFQLQPLSHEHNLEQQFSKFKVIQNSISLPIKQQQQAGEQLQQRQLGQLQLQQVQKQGKVLLLCDRLSRNKKKKQNKQQINFGAAILDEKKHKDILRYLGNKYRGVFMDVLGNVRNTLGLDNDPMCNRNSAYYDTLPNSNNSSIVLE